MKQQKVKILKEVAAFDGWYNSYILKPGEIYRTETNALNDIYAFLHGKQIKLNSDEFIFI